jgi:hypothetical protein
VIRRLSLICAACLGLCACGSQRDLKPPMGHELPPPPYGRTDRPTANELLTPTPQAVPVRSEELRRQSEEREDDPFDLPPEDTPRKN